MNAAFLVFLEEYLVYRLIIQYVIDTAHRLCCCHHVHCTLYNINDVISHCASYNDVANNSQTLAVASVCLP